MASPAFTAVPAVRVTPGLVGQTNGMVWQTDACRQGRCHVYQGDARLTAQPLLCGGGGRAPNDQRTPPPKPADHPAACFVTDPADVRAVRAACATADGTNNGRCTLWDGASPRAPAPAAVDWSDALWLATVPRFGAAERQAWGCTAPPPGTLGAVPNVLGCSVGGAAVDAYPLPAGALLYGPVADCAALARHPSHYRALRPSENGTEPAFVSVLDAASGTSGGPCARVPTDGSPGLGCTA